MSGVPLTHEQYQEQQEMLSAQLAAVNLDGPFHFENPLGAITIFGPMPRSKYAICKLCGAMIALYDPERDEETGEASERSVRVHTEWHRIIELAAGVSGVPVDPDGPPSDG